eukprot:Ihof_evm3s979 gene=Ihof_evmTU3s979
MINPRPRKDGVGFVSDDYRKISANIPGISLEDYEKLSVKQKDHLEGLVKNLELLEKGMVLD